MLRYLLYFFYLTHAGLQHPQNWVKSPSGLGLIRSNILLVQALLFTGSHVDLKSIYMEPSIILPIIFIVMFSDFRSPERRD